ncbi:hypothetical protein JOB18_028617 [Solea senegalensis]|uniref:Uncharacterized protein n=1 Tax=Solea senegalensis TaxID=28829 RepID=A0AAV6R547_SOLSE|nr:hypothetical protein JOB18_028617 [Solea senegalensis]
MRLLVLKHDVVVSVNLIVPGKMRLIMIFIHNVINMSSLCSRITPETITDKNTFNHDTLERQITRTRRTRRASFTHGERRSHAENTESVLPAVKEAVHAETERVHTPETESVVHTQRTRRRRSPRENTESVVHAENTRFGRERRSHTRGVIHTENTRGAERFTRYATESVVHARTAGSTRESVRRREEKPRPPFTAGEHGSVVRTRENRKRSRERPRRRSHAENRRTSFTRREETGHVVPPHGTENHGSVFPQRTGVVHTGEASFTLQNGSVVPPETQASFTAENGGNVVHTEKRHSHRKREHGRRVRASFTARRVVHRGTRRARTWASKKHGEGVHGKQAPFTRKNTSLGESGPFTRRTGARTRRFRTTEVSRRTSVHVHCREHGSARFTAEGSCSPLRTRARSHGGTGAVHGERVHTEASFCAHLNGGVHTGERRSFTEHGRHELRTGERRSHTENTESVVHTRRTRRASFTRREHGERRSHRENSCVNICPAE